jgi:hypothetical protein
MARRQDQERRQSGRAARQRLQAEYAFTTREIPEDLWEEEPVDSPFWDVGEPYEVYEPAGGGRMRTGAAEPYGSAFSEEDAGDSWDQFFAPAVDEPYALEESDDPFDPYRREDEIGDLEPYGGERYWYGRESHPRLGNPELPEDYEYGQLYGYPQRRYAHRRDLYYAGALVPPEEARRRVRRRRRRAELTRDFTGEGPKGYVRSDERIREEVVQLLTDAPWVDAREMEVRVESGEVYLEGTVEDRQTSRAAEVLAASVLGVVDVHNRLRRRSNGAGLGAEA